MRQIKVYRADIFFKLIRKMKKLLKYSQKPLANYDKMCYTLKVDERERLIRILICIKQTDSKGSRAHHSATCESSCFLAISLKCFIFLEFWMNAFQFRPCKSLAKFKLNLIRRDIEVVITGLTRNQFALTRTRVRIPLSPPNAASAAKEAAGLRGLAAFYKFRRL